jgi:hypothetical protein
VRKIRIELIQRCFSKWSTGRSVDQWSQIPITLMRKRMLSGI